MTIKKTDRINELFSRLNLQIIQDNQISRLNKEGYVYIDDIVERLGISQEELLESLYLFKDDIKFFKKSNGDSYILLKFSAVEEWYGFEGCIPLVAAKNFTDQKGISEKYLVKAIENKELHIREYDGEDMLNEEDLVIWMERRKI